jgi:hypothetical protein
MWFDCVVVGGMGVTTDKEKSFSIHSFLIFSTIKPTSAEVIFVK